MIAPAPVTFRLWHVLAAAVVAVVVAFLLLGCSGFQDGSVAAASELDDELRDAAQGCDWRATRAVGYDPHDPSACYDVFTGPNARIAFFPVENPCDARDLPSPVLVEPGNSAELWGYWDRSELEAFEILRYKQVECPKP